MIGIVKIVLMLSLLSIFYQDLKERKVYWFLFPIVGFCVGILHFQNTTPSIFINHSVINLIIIGVLLGVVFLYSRFRLKTTMDNAFGLGDTLLFIALAFSFVTTTFVTFFVFGLITALILHRILKQKSKYQTVPLAGYLALFFALAYTLYWSGFTDNLYNA